MQAFALLSLALCWLVPHHLPPWTAFHTEAPAFFSAILIGILLVRSRSFRIESGPIVAAVLAILAGVQNVLGIVTYSGDVWLVFAYCGLFAIGWHWADVVAKSVGDIAFMHQLKAISILAGLMVAFQALAQTLMVHEQFGDWVLEPLYDGRARANLGQPNQAATTLMLAIISACALHAQKKICAPILGAVLIVFALALTTTQSRTGLLSGIVSFLFLLWVGRANRVSISYKFAAFAWVAFTVFVAWQYAHRPSEMIISTVDDKALTSPGTRPILWSQFSAAIAERPLLGWGWLQVSTAQQFGAIDFPGTEQTNYTHNIVLDLMAMLGLPIGLAVVLLTVGWLSRRWNEYHADNQRIWVFALLIPLAIHSMLEFPHAYAYFILICAALMGILKPKSAHNSKLPISFIVYSSARVGIVAWICLIGGLAREYMLVEEDYRINRFENRRIGTTSPDYSPPKLYLLTQMAELLAAMRLRATPGMDADELMLLDRISSRYTWAPLLFRSILANGLNDRQIVASRQLQTLKSMFNASVYEEARINLESMAEDRYPQLKKIQLP